MLIQQTTYPEFVADQILSSDHLNRLFGFLDEQERLTRANLLGIGIVCGLDVKLNTGGTQLTITKGSGITSKGYLVSANDTTYLGYKEYDIDRNHTYPLFTDIFLEDPNSGFKAYELVQSTNGATPLSANFLQDYIVMMYVELRAESAEDCDTNNCDYEGIMVTVNLKPLLIPKSFAPLFISGAADVSAGIANLPEVALRRFDVTATTLDGSAAIIQGYRSILADQVGQLRTALAATFSTLYPFVYDEFPTDPFQQLIGDLFSFLADGTYPLNDMLHIQYYYDLVSDIYNLYEQVRENGDHLISMCNPDQYLFPQHLMLGPAVNFSQDGSKVDYRNYFMPSGAVKSCCGGIGDLRLSFKNLYLLLARFALPQVYTEQVEIGTSREAAAVPIRITPDVIGNVSLSEKSIPFYYDVANGTDKLYRYWNAAKTYAGMADRNLSYHAEDYRTGSADDPILKPLFYDIEDYNFFRIEGGNGMQYRAAVNAILTLRNQHRLPFDVVAIRSSEPAASLFKKLCCGDGLELSYDIVRREWEAALGETIAFINSNIEFTRTLLGTDETDGDRTSKFIAKLQAIKAYLVDDMSAFMAKYDLFIAAFESIEADCSTLRDIVYGQMGDQGGSVFQFGEDLIDHLDELGHSHMKGSFRAVWQAYKGLGASIEETLTLREYLQLHPGITHKAGVPVGGTFVLVYHTESKETDGDPGAVDDMLAQLPEGTVIADFYLPYLCCSDCTPVQVTIGNGQPVVKPEISIEGGITKLCQGSGKQQYDLTVTPVDANVTADVAGAVSFDGTKWHFIPGAVTIADSATSKPVTITCEKDGQTSSITITMYATPQLSFSTSQNGNTIFVTNTSTHTAQNAVTWSFGDGFTSSDYNPTPHTYATLTTSKTYTITLSATSNGVCNAPATFTKTVTIASSLPCGGQKQYCDYVWNYPQLEFREIQGDPKLPVTINLTVNKYFVGSQNIVPAAQTFPPIQVSTGDFYMVWPTIAAVLNQRYNQTSFSQALKFMNTVREGQTVITIENYPCLDFYFEFDLWETWGNNTSARHRYIITNVNFKEVDLKYNVKYTAPANCALPS